MEPIDMTEFQGGGATRKTGSCCDLLKRHSGPDPESINVDKNRLRLGAGVTGTKSNILRPEARSNEGSRMLSTSFRHSDESQSLSMPVNSICHSELVSESLNKEIDSGSEAGMTNLSHVYQPCHPELDSGSINADRNNLRSIGRSDQLSRKAAFTMAEVLITLGIIGIVAAMTLPSLIGKYQEKQWKVAYKKSYSSISQAFLRMQEDGDFIAITPESVVDGVRHTSAIGENFKTMSKYFNTVKTCFDKNQDECWVCEDGQAGRGAGPEWLGCNKNAYAFIDYSGIAWALYNNNEFPILVDVNGEKRPNKLGRDRFVLLFGSNNSDEIYSANVNTISPWIDFKYKTRWCPSGNCLYKTWILE